MSVKGKPIQPTPTLSGKDAKAIIAQASIPPKVSAIEKLRNRKLKVERVLGSK